jgi:hypothetical protein
MTEVKNGKIIHTVKLGTDSNIVIRSQDLPGFDEIRMDIKNTERFQADPLFALSSLEGGIVVEESGAEKILTIPITNNMTEQFKLNRLFFDIKFRVGEIVLDTIIPGEILTNNTVTNV